MKKIILILTILIPINANAFWVKMIDTTVIDGDTIKAKKIYDFANGMFRTEKSVRLVLINAPERKTERGIKSKKALEILTLSSAEAIKSGTSNNLMCEIYSISYNRLVGNCFKNGVDVGLQLLLLNFATLTQYKNPQPDHLFDFYQRRVASSFLFQLYQLSEPLQKLVTIESKRLKPENR